MKKRLLCMILTLTMIFCLVPSAAAAASDEATEAAEALYELGLFKGTGTNSDGTPIFELDKTPTRNQAVIMLVRLLGKEKEALAGNWELPFTDVAKSSTAYPYIGYAYANGLTNGTSTTTYSGTNLIKANQYITFVLRALGYTSGKDFFVSTAWEFSDKIGLTHGEYNATKQFTRGDISVISLSALSTMVYHSERTLVEKLVSENVISIQSAVSAGLIVWKGDPYLWGVTMQCDEVIYDHEADCWPVSSSKEETKLTIKAIGKDQYHRPFDVNPKNGFFWGLTDSFEKSKERDIQTQLNGVSIECDKNDPSTAVVTIPPNTDTEVWVYAGARRGQDFIRYPYLMKITPEGAVDYRAWYEVDDRGMLYIKTNIDSQNWGGYSVISEINYRNGDSSWDEDWGTGIVRYIPAAFITHHDVGTVITSTEFYVFEGICEELYDCGDTNTTLEEMISDLSDQLVCKIVLTNKIFIENSGKTIHLEDITVSNDIKNQKNTYTISIADEILETGLYDFHFTCAPTQNRGGSLKRENDVLVITLDSDFFPASEKTGEFHVTHSTFSIDNNGNILCKKTISNRVNANI